MAEAFVRPLRATHHCRHYSYEPGLKGGPRCAKGLDPFASPGFVLRRCCSEPTEVCHARQEYTDAEREAWEVASAAGMDRLGKAVQALPRAIPLRTSGEIVCPNCEGRLRYARWHRGAEIACSTPGCCGAHFNIAAGADWPAHRAGEGN